MKQVIQNVKTGELQLKNVPAPSCGKGEILVATAASLISAGTEKMVMDFAGKSLIGKAKERPDLVKKVVNKLQKDGAAATIKSVFAQLEAPLPLGYSAAGVVVEVGETLSGEFKKGDHVAIAGAGLANHAEINAVPKNLAVKLDKNLPFDHAAFATVGAIAMQGVRSGKITLGDRVLVMGAGLVGQLASQFSKLSGAKVMVMDYLPERLALALECGADEAFNLKEKNALSAIDVFTHGRGFDSILICAATDSNAPIEQAAAFARDRANIVLVGKVGTTLPYAEFMKKELNVIISRSYGAGRYDPNFEQKGQNYPAGYVPWTQTGNLAEAARLMATGALKIEPLISHAYDINDAHEAYAVVQAKDIACMGVVLTYPDAKAALNDITVQLETTPNPNLEESNAPSISARVSCIGAGGFSRSVLFPILKKLEHVTLHTVVSKGGLSAQSAAEKFGFSAASSDTAAALKDTVTDLVCITTRHDSHAELVVAALKAGKHVFVEKPLALNFEQLEDIQKAQQKAKRSVIVGTNRRFSPHVNALQKAFATVKSPRQCLIRVNAGKLDADNWQSDRANGGGRLLGEAAPHFIDTALALIPSKPVQIRTLAGQGQDVYSIEISFADGSIACIFYTSEGGAAQEKEVVELHAGGQTGVIQNFRKTLLYSSGNRKTLYKGGLVKGVQKGHFETLNLLTQFVIGARQNLPINQQDVFISATLALLAVQSAQQNGVAIKIES